MKIDIIKFRDILKELDMDKPWIVGTNIYSYIQKFSLFVEHNISNINSDDVLEVKQTYPNLSNQFNVTYLQDQMITGKSYSAVRQFLDTLLSFELIKKETYNSFKFNSKFVEFLGKTDLELIDQIREYVNVKLLYCLKKYILNTLVKYKEENIDTEHTKQEGKFWWNILIEFWIADKENDGRESKYLLDRFDLDNQTQESKRFFKKVVEEFFFSEKYKEKTYKIIKEFNQLFKKNLGINLSNVWSYNKIKQQKQNLSIDIKIKGFIGDDKNQPNIKPLSIYTFFNLDAASNYALPIFQRTYVWDTTIIGSMFESIFEDFEKNKEGNCSFSYLNTIIFTWINHSYAILDGQQRITSLIIITIALIRYSQHFGNKVENINIERYVSYNKIKKIIENFKKSDDNYNDLSSIWEGDKSSIKNIRFKDNYNFICDIIDNKFKNNFDQLQEFILYFYNKVFFIFAYLTNQEDEQTTRIFQNLNQYGKPLGVLDLFRNYIYQKYNGEKEKKDEIINKYNETFNLYFRKNARQDQDENIKNIITFVDSTLIKYGMFSEIDEINKNYNNKTTATILKLQYLFDYYEKNLQIKSDVLHELLHDLLIFDYVSGKAKYDESKFNIREMLSWLNDNNQYKYKQQNLDKLFNNEFISIQIKNLSNNGRKSVFTSLITLIIQKLDLFSNQSKNYIEFSKFLAIIERFTLIWDVNFEGQSLTNSIQRICGDIIGYDSNNFEQKTTRDFIYKQLLASINVNVEKIYDDFEYEKNLISRIHQNLEEKFIHTSSKKQSNDDAKRFIIQRVIQITKNNNPLYYDGREQDNNSYIKMTFDHILPQKQPAELKVKFKSEEEYNIYVNKIGNGRLLSKKDNSSKGNNINKQDALEITNYNYTVKGISSKQPMKILDLNGQQLIIQNKYLELLSQPNLKTAPLEEIKQIIDTRSTQILSAYLSIFFAYHWDN
ncbi:Protein of uncharacterised function DUF262 [Mesomycoplasma conjunctivae]|nr:Protein of uncharacterised function DUF262 [Mesomycoplasma conjunctivae]